MAKPELGIKRLCAGCGAKYYDLNRDPIVCPKCGAEFQLVVAATPTTAPKPATARKVDDDDDTDLETESDDVEVISLEDAEEEEEAGEDIPDLGDDDIEDADTDIGGDSALIEDDDDDDDDDGVIDIVPKASADDS